MQDPDILNRLKSRQATTPAAKNLQPFPTKPEEMSKLPDRVQKWAKSYVWAVEEKRTLSAEMIATRLSEQGFLPPGI